MNASAIDYAELAAFNAARRHRHHHHMAGRNRDEAHDVAPEKARSMMMHAGPFMLKKLAGTITAGGIGFWDTYAGMTAIGADKDGKGGMGLDLIWSIITNGLDFWGALRKAGPIGGVWVGSGISGTADASWYMWFGKQLQIYGASKKAGAEAAVGESVDYTQRGAGAGNGAGGGGGGDDARGGTPSMGAGGPRMSAEHLVIDPLAGFR